MNANELTLMVGDLILHNNRPKRVDVIWGNAVSLYDPTKDWGSIYGNKYYDGIEPIPLQKVHLTKNGFKPTDESDRVFVYNDGYEVIVEFHEAIEEFDIPPSIFLSIQFAEKDMRMPIKYVHQLQQAMQIMGCDKKIEL